MMRRRPVLFRPVFPFPTVYTTGVPHGTSLTSSGPVSSSSNGQIIEALDVNGAITINHTNVVVRRCNVLNGSISINNSGATVEDCKVNPNAVENGCCGILADNATVRRCDFSNFENGMFVDSSTSGHVIRDNYIHDPIPYNPVLDPHIDGIQMWASGVDNVLIEHNSILCSSDSSSAVTGGDTNTRITVNNNRLNGGSYTMYVMGAGSVTNNRFGYHAFGYIIGGITGDPIFSGNVDDITGAPVLPP